MTTTHPLTFAEWRTALREKTDAGFGGSVGRWCSLPGAIWRLCQAARPIVETFAEAMRALDPFEAQLEATA